MNAKDNASNGIEFTEVMEGNLYIGDTIGDLNMAAREAVGSGDTAHIYLSAPAFDTDVCKGYLKDAWSPTR